MITNLTISNFKSIKELSLELSTINIFIGQNRSGKSSVQQAFGLLKQSPKRDLVWDGTAVNLKDFKNILNKQAKENLISIRFGGTDYASADLETMFDMHKITFGINYDIDESGLVGIDYGIEGRRPILFEGRISRTSSPRTNLDIQLEGSSVKIAEVMEIHHPLRISGGNHSADVEQERFDEIYFASQKLLEIFSRYLENFVFVPVLRGFDKAAYPLTSTNPISIPTGEGLSRQAEQAASSLAYNKAIEKQVSKIIGKIIKDVKIEHQLQPSVVSIISEDEHGEYNIASEGFGLNQLTFLFQQLVTAKENSVVFIEEPEIALHPAAHADVCNALIEELLRVPKQLVITTHSEHILLGFLDAIMEKRLPHTRIKVYYFEREEGITKVTPLEVTEKGELIGGLRGFFEADMKHLDRFLNSMKQK